MDSNPSSAHCECASGSSHVTEAQSGPCRPMCGAAQPGQLYGCSAAHAGCGDVRSWIAPGRPPTLACACALRWGSCESDPIGRTAQNGFFLQLVVVLRVRRARALSLEARARYWCEGDRGSTVPMLCVLLCDRRCKAEPTTRTGLAAAAAQPAAVCTHAARATAHVHRAIASPSERA